MLERMKKEVYDAIQMFPTYNLAAFTLGNVSGIDRAKGLIVIKPSGLEYAKIALEDLLVVDMNGRCLEGKHPVPAELSTHLELYKAFSSIQSITHTYSHWATIFAQMSMGIPALGTIHADYFHGEIPCTRKLRPYEIRGDYDKELGIVIVERFKKGKLSYEEIPGVLVSNSGPYTWGSNPGNALLHAAILEEVAFMAWHCMALPDKYLVPMQKDLLERHFNKRHGFDTTYVPEQNVSEEMLAKDNT